MAFNVFYRRVVRVCSTYYVALPKEFLRELRILRGTGLVMRRRGRFVIFRVAENGLKSLLKGAK